MTASFERLVNAGVRPLEELHLGSEWQRLEVLFGREANEERRSLLLGAFNGREDPPVTLEASYGPARLVGPGDAAHIAQALRARGSAEARAKRAGRASGRGRRAGHD